MIHSHVLTQWVHSLTKCIWVTGRFRMKEPEFFCPTVIFNCSSPRLEAYQEGSEMYSRYICPHIWKPNKHQGECWGWRHDEVGNSIHPVPETKQELIQQKGPSQVRGAKGSPKWANSPAIALVKQGCWVSGAPVRSAERPSQVAPNGPHEAGHPRHRQMVQGPHRKSHQDVSMHWKETKIS